MYNLFELSPKTIEVCDYCGCYRSITIEKTVEGDILYVCDECYPIYSDRTDEVEEDKERKDFKWKEV